MMIFKNSIRAYKSCKRLYNQAILNDDYFGIEALNAERFIKNNVVNVTNQVPARSQVVAPMERTKPNMCSQKLSRRLDSQGFNLFDKQICDWNKVPQYQIIEELLKNILYENESFVVLNKPAGLSTMGDKKSLHSINDVLQNLSKSLPMPCDNLYIVHRLDKEVSGTLILAKNPKIQAQLNDCFQRRLVHKVYWAIIVGHPDTQTGIINLPLVEKEFQGIYKTFVLPKTSECVSVMSQYTMDPDNRRESRRPMNAISEYAVIDKAEGVSLLQIKSKTGYKHQVRAHLAYGLGCPILGDHKYSHIHELKPQRLPQIMLKNLKVRPTKTRTLTLHLHAFSITLPPFMIPNGDASTHGEKEGTFKNRNSSFIDGLELQARTLPLHFCQNMAALNLNKYLK